MMARGCFFLDHGKPCLIANTVALEALASMLLQAAERLKTEGRDPETGAITIEFDAPAASSHAEACRIVGAVEASRRPSNRKPFIYAGGDA